MVGCARRVCARAFRHAGRRIGESVITGESLSLLLEVPWVVGQRRLITDSRNGLRLGEVISRVSEGLSSVKRLKMRESVVRESASVVVGSGLCFP